MPIAFHTVTPFFTVFSNLNAMDAQGLESHIQSATAKVIAPSLPLCGKLAAIGYSVEGHLARHQNVPLVFVDDNC